MEEGWLQQGAGHPCRAADFQWWTMCLVIAMRSGNFVNFENLLTQSLEGADSGVSECASVCERLRIYRATLIYGQP